MRERFNFNERGPVFVRGCVLVVSVLVRGRVLARACVFVRGRVLMRGCGFAKGVSW